MSLFIETLLIEEGKVCNLPFHQYRFDKTRKELFGGSSLLLSPLLSPPLQGKYRCKILYNENIHEITYTPYEKREIHKLLLSTETISYPYKYADRPFKDQLPLWDTLYVKDGLLTDTTICNIALFKNNQWFTPKSPLLEGTTRHRLLDEGFLKLSDLEVTKLMEYEHIAIMNALRGFDVLGRPQEVVFSKVLSDFCYNRETLERFTDSEG